MAAISSPLFSRTFTKQRATKTKPRYDATIVGLLRALAAEIADLQDSLNQIKSAGDLQDAQAREKEVNRIVTSEVNTYKADALQVESYLQRLGEILDKNLDHNQEYRGTLDKLGALWRRAVRQWPMPPAEGAEPSPTADLLAKVAQVLARLDAIRYEIAVITFASRLEEHLEAVGIGTRIDFAQVDFLGSDLPLNMQLQQQVFQYLRDHPQAIRNGIIIQGTLVVRIEENALVQTRSALLVIAVLLLGAAAIWFVSALPAASLASVPFASQFTQENRVTLLILYALIFLGASAHIVIDFVKQGSQATSNGVLSGSLALWIHMHEGEMLRWAFYIMITFCALLALNGSGGLQVATAFFMGYTMDSVVDVSLQRFDKAVSTQQVAIQGSLSAL